MKLSSAVLNLMALLLEGGLLTSVAAVITARVSRGAKTEPNGARQRLQDEVQRLHGEVLDLKVENARLTEANNWLRSGRDT